MIKRAFYILGVLSFFIIIFRYEILIYPSFTLFLEYILVDAFTFFFVFKIIRRKKIIYADIWDFVFLLFTFLLYKEFNTYLLLEFYILFTQFFLFINGLLDKLPSSKLNPATVISAIFLIIIGIGTFLLLLPGATYKGISFIDALFTATSATCVTGLVVQDTGSFFTLPGQVIILALIQLGGLGIITFSTFFAILFRGGISITERVVVKDYLGNVTWRIEDILKNILIFTFAFEGIGTLLLFIKWYKEGVKLALYNAFFHSVSAFCNAGFSLFRDNLVSFQGDIWTNLVFITLIVSGGLGFLVMYDITYFFSLKLKGIRARLSLHSKIVLITTFLLIVGSLFGFMLFSNQPFIISLFQVVSARTAGFNTINISVLSSSAIFLLILLMIIGASPGSTGGGIKTSTFALIILYLRSILRGKKRTEVFNRNIPHSIIEKAFVITVLYIFTLVGSILLITWVERDISFLDLFFETTSAIGTVGYSLGATSHLHFWGKLIIIINMIVGRIGPLTIVFAVRKEEKDFYSYPEEKVLVG